MLWKKSTDESHSSAYEKYTTRDSFLIESALPRYKPSESILKTLPRPFWKSRLSFLPSFPLALTLGRRRLPFHRLWLASLPDSRHINWERCEQKKPIPTAMCNTVASLRHSLDTLYARCTPCQDTPNPNSRLWSNLLLWKSKVLQVVISLESRRCRATKIDTTNRRPYIPTRKPPRQKGTRRAAR